jgi:C4-dicarboxylate-specific signal transduction histidine kinase
MKPDLRSPLAYRIVQRFTAGGLLLLSIIMIFVVSYELSRQQRIAKETAEQYLVSTNSSMATALWNYDLGQVQALAGALLALDSVRTVVVRDNAGMELLRAHDLVDVQPDNTNSADVELALRHLYGPNQIAVGSTQLFLQLPGVRDFLDTRLVVIAGAAMLFFICFSAFVLFDLRREIIKPVAAVSRFIRELPGDIQQNQELALPDRSGQKNEIDDLVQSINGFVGQIVDERAARQRAELETSAMAEEIDRIGRITAAQSIATLIAHEINQPLGAALFNAESALSIIKRDPGVDPVLKSVLEDIVSQTHRASEVVQSIRNIVQNSRAPHEPVSARTLITESLQLLRFDSRFRNIPVEFTNITDTFDFHVMGDLRQLQRVVINILANAADAIRGAEIDNGWITIGFDRRNISSFNITISDNGPGLTPGFLNTNADIKPYLSNKPDGMGVGLWIAQLLTERHGGSLEFGNNIAGGAVFRISLPIYEQVTA